MIPSADAWILDGLQYLYENPIFTGLLLGVAGWLAGKTKTRVDDRIVARVAEMLGRDSGDNKGVTQ